MRMAMAPLRLLLLAAATLSPAHAPGNSSGLSSATVASALPPVAAAESALLGRHTAAAGSSGGGTASDGGGTTKRGPPPPLPSVHAVEALLRERWTTGPPPPLARDAPPPPPKPKPPPPHTPAAMAADCCRGGPPCPPGCRSVAGGLHTTKPKAPLKATNLTGAFRGTWTLPMPNRDGPFFLTAGTIQHQVKAWQTNATNAHYLQSAILLRDGAYSTSHDSRISLEGVYLHKEGKVAMFSRHPNVKGGFFTSKMAENISTVATRYV